MDINKRIAYISYLIIGVLFVLAGIALEEPNLLFEALNTDTTGYYEFLMPWIGNAEDGIPSPW